MWQLVPWVSRRKNRRRAADQAMRTAQESQRAEHDAAMQRILTQAYSR